MSRPTQPAAARVAGPGNVDDLVTAVLTASRVLVGVSARSLAGIEGTLTVAQFRTLVVLDSHGEVNLLTLAGRLGVTPSTAVRMIDRLLAADLVTRRDNPGNRREVLLATTPQARQIVDTVTERRRAEISRIVTAMPAAQRDELIMALRAFADAASEPEPSDALANLAW